jgi:predicted phosphodiesterase
LEEYGKVILQRDNNMKLFFCSDLHYGSPIFGWKEEDFLKTLKNLIKEEDIERVIFLGDTIDYFYTSRKELEKREFTKILYKNYTIVQGNHDISCHIAEYDFNYINKEGIDILAEHGHQADFLNGTIFGRIIVNIFFKYIKKIIPEELFIKYIMWSEETEYGVTRKHDRYKYLVYAFKKLKNHDIVITGHTHHKPEKVKTWINGKKKIWLNTGSCCLNKFQGIILDTETLELKIIK